MANKTIVISINTSWNILNFRKGLLLALKDEGYRIVCVAPKDEYSSKLKDLGFEYYDIQINNKGTNPLEDLKLVYNFYKLYKQINPDVILQYTIKPNIYGSFAARALKIPVISNISGLGTVFLSDNISSKIARKLYKFALKKNLVFFQNSYDKDLFIKNALVNKNQVDLVAGSGINTDIFKASCKNQINSEFTFLMVARLVKDKGLIEYIDAIKIIKRTFKNVRFKLLGSLYLNNPTAISQEELDNWINDGLIDYLGHSDNVQVEMEKVDCIVLPSYREGLSRVLLEAGSLSKPMITTNTPGCKDVVGDGVNGYLCEVKDSKGLALCMEKMLSLALEDRLKMGEESRKKVVNEFDEKLIIEKYSKAIKKVL